MARPKPDEDAARSLILEKATRLVVKGGFDALTMKQLAVDSSMAVGKLYRFFPSKDAIFLELEIDFFRKVAVLLESALATTASPDSKDPEDRLQQMLTAFYHFASEHLDIYRLVTSPPKVFRDYIGTPLEQLAKEELEAAMLAINSLRDFLAAALGARPIGEQEQADYVQWSLQDRFLFLINGLHGIILNSHSRIFPYVSRSGAELADNRYEAGDPVPVAQQQIKHLVRATLA